MLINSYASNGLDEIFGVQAVDSNNRKYSRVAEQTTASGDTVDISDEARRLYSEMIHKYDQPQSSGGDAESGQGESGASGQAQGGGGAQGGGSSDSTDEVENIKKQIQALKSQLMAMASQVGTDGKGNAAMGKMNALQSQIAALEAQLNAMEQAA